MKTTLTQIDVPPVQLLTVAQVPVYWIPCPDELPVKVECIFEAGRRDEHKRLAGLTAHHLIKEATIDQDSGAYAKAWDQVGSEIFTHYYYDCCSMGFRALYPFHVDCLDLLFECLIAPRFDLNDLQVFVEQQKQELEIDLGQADSVADREWNHWLFGSQHPLGYLSTPTLYDDLTTADLKIQHQISYQSRKLSLVIMAHRPDQALKRLETLLAGLPKPDPAHQHPQSQNTVQSYPNSIERIHAQSPSDRDRYIANRNIEGSALRMGDFGPIRSHPNFVGFQLLIHLLGGYFGSRLIQEVREKRGLVYHIQSQIEVYRNQTVYQVSADTSSENLKPTEQIILQEMNQLQQTLVPDEELTMAKNFLRGHLLQLIDNPLRQSAWMKQLLVEGIEIQQVKEEWSQLWAINPSQIRDLAAEHLTINTLRKLKVN